MPTNIFQGLVNRLRQGARDIAIKAAPLSNAPVFDALQNVQETPSKIFSEARRQGGNIFSGLSQRVQEAAPESKNIFLNRITRTGLSATPLGPVGANVLPDSTVRSVREDVAPAVASFIKTAQEEVARSGASLAISSLGLGFRGAAPVVGAIAGPEAQREVQQRASNLSTEPIEVGGQQDIVGRIGALVFGDRPLESIEYRIARGEMNTQDFARQLQQGQIDVPFLSTDSERGAGESIEMAALPLSALAIGGMIGLDFTGAGGTSKNAARLLAKIDDVGEIVSIGRKIGIAEDLLEGWAETVARTSDVATIERSLDNINAIQRSTRVAQEAAGVSDSSSAGSRPLSDPLPKDIPSGLPLVSQTQGERIGTSQARRDLLFSGSDSLPVKYAKIGDESSVIQDADLALGPTRFDTSKLPLYSRFKNLSGRVATNIREVVEDDMIRVKQLLRDKKFTVTEDSDPYLKEILFHGRVASRIDDAKDVVQSIDKDIIQTAKNINVDDAKLTKDVNDFLIARHAPERNARLGEGAAGITTKEAEETIRRINSSESASEVKRIADLIQDLNNKTLDVLLEGQVITKDLYDLLRDTYKNHIPLNRIFAESEDISTALTGRGFDVRGTGLKQAKGSNREVADVLTNVVANYEQAVIRAEKNAVDLATLRFYRENKESLDGLISEVKPKAIGKTFDGKVILEQITDPQVLAIRENGKPVYLRINDKSLAAALKGVNREKLDGLMKFVGTFTRFYSGLMTRFNPEFALPNKIRDLQEMFVYMASKEDVGFSGAARSVSRDPGSVKDVVDAIRGADTEGARLYKEMVSEGGTTGGLGLSTRKQVELDVDEIRKLNRSNPRKAAQKTLEYVDYWNTIFEDSSRLSVYKEARSRGLSKARSAVLAKEASVNFNKMGKGGPIINSLYMFSNASIQGSAKMLRAMKNPKVAGSVITMVGASTFATNEWNDSIDPNWRSKVSEWDRLNGFPVVLPGGDEGEFRYITVPVSWGIKPIKVATDKVYDLATSYTTVDDALETVFASIVEGYNPAGGTDFTSAIVPTVFDLPVDIARNKEWSGSVIKPDFDKNAPASIKYFDSLKDSVEGRTFISAADKLSEFSGRRIEISPADINYAYQQLIGGTGRFGSKVSNTITSLFKGEKPEVREIPFGSRFFRSIPEEEIGAGSQVISNIRDILGEQSRERFFSQQQAEDFYGELKKMPGEDRYKATLQLKQENPLIYEKVIEIGKEDQLGLTYTDRLVKQLGVQNGERAKYILTTLESLPKGEERYKYLSEMQRKGIITPAVIEQMALIKKGGKY